MNTLKESKGTPQEQKYAKPLLFGLAFIVLIFQLVSNLQWNITAYSARLHREETSPSIQFYADVKQNLAPLIDINLQFYSKFEVLELVEQKDGCSLTGRVWGEDIDHEKHDTRTEVKAMTYADMKFEQSENSTTLWFTLDL